MRDLQGLKIILAKRASADRPEMRRVDPCLFGRVQGKSRILITDHADDVGDDIFYEVFGILIKKALIALKASEHRGLDAADRQTPIDDSLIQDLCSDERCIGTVGKYG